jgi:hypothetical protein
MGKLLTSKKAIDVKIDEEPDFVCLKRFDFSLQKVLERYPEGAPNHVIASALNISDDEAQELYESALVKIRTFMKVD